VTQPVANSVVTCKDELKERSLEEVGSAPVATPWVREKGKGLVMGGLGLGFPVVSGLGLGFG
jgi:hypothetical protein